MFFASVHLNGTKVHFLHIVMYCWKMKSVIDSSYTGTEIAYTSAIMKKKFLGPLPCSAGTAFDHSL
jgi:hypothetical protein